MTYTSVFVFPYKDFKPGQVCPIDGDELELLIRTNHVVRVPVTLDPKLEREPEPVVEEEPETLQDGEEPSEE